VSGVRPNINSIRRTYTNSPASVSGGYTTNHPHFKNEDAYWKQMSFALSKAAKATNVLGNIVVRVQMGTLFDRQKNIVMMGVSIYFESSIEFSMHSYIMQNIVDGISNLDPHIGGNLLHCRCFEQLEQCWLSWSGEYHIEIQNTTL